jgi:hypothetical protein
MYRLERMDSPIPHCIIRNNKIWKNDEMIFEKKSVSLNDFMAEAYSFLKIGFQSWAL